MNIPVCPECGMTMELTSSTRYICLSHTTNNSVHHVFRCSKCDTSAATVEVLGYSGPIVPPSAIEESVYWRIGDDGVPTIEG